ncbi:hypothetical protein [Vitiosangium sp. GDMCC 1.1324]|uniref:hypothetical protein n=1 Tax=Vitiosangium sp. (strain GDMCC 1.1324) TaxID=2138576 RepID=UPI000D3B063C|nr:hypothetical protein [Vitiosangium sp. GDMCC 1.1324]PTL84393.1 hypothetical protein DAT35_04675 [Vitiosangium sp. GDMCC 1.1324]
MKAERIFIPTPSAPASLCWCGDGLVDWVSGGCFYGLDGSTADPHVRYAYRFDSAVMSQDGRYAVLYEKLGTKGLLLHQGKVLRELNRSFYHATTYEYPVALVTLPSGRTLLAHCPDEYCCLELEDAETGERLTRRDSSSPDFFHSRLQFSRDGRYLVSAGWIWHPVDAASVFDVARALEQPQSLDEPQALALDDSFLEFHSAAFGERDTLVLECTGLDGEGTPFSDGQPADTARLAVYSLSERRFLSMAPLEAPAGTLMAMGGYAVGFYEHPKLFELATGRVLERWPELDTGRQGSSIIRHLPPLPPLALDPAGRRFAVGTDKGIEVVRFTPE